MSDEKLAVVVDLAKYRVDRNLLKAIVKAVEFVHAPSTGAPYETLGYNGPMPRVIKATPKKDTK